MTSNGIRSLRSGSRNGTRESLPHPFTLRRIARCLWPRQRSRAWKIDSDGTHIGPQTLGRPAALREATDATVTGRLQGVSPDY